MFRYDCAGCSFYFRHGGKETLRSFVTQQAHSFSARQEACENEQFRNNFLLFCRLPTISTGISLRIRKR
jgi:hypothetical protein